jgi:hypothetical protein
MRVPGHIAQQVGQRLMHRLIAALHHDRFVGKFQKMTAAIAWNKAHANHLLSTAGR